MEVPRENSKPEQRRRKFTWPKEALKLIQQRRHPAALCEELASLTGNDKNACWRFLKRNCIHRPGSRSRRSFPRDRVDAIIEYIGEHAVGAASERFGCKPKALEMNGDSYRLKQSRRKRNLPARRSLSG
jgi:hypothetical protein